MEYRLASKNKSKIFNLKTIVMRQLFNTRKKTKILKHLNSTLPIFSFLVASLMLGTMDISAQCEPDTSPPPSSDISLVGDATPVISNCPGDITIFSESGECGATVVYGPVTASDNCDEVTLFSPTGVNIKGGYFEIGLTEVEYVAIDGNGLETSCSFTVEVINSEVATIVCPPSLTLDSDRKICGLEDVDLGIAIAQDLCQSYEVTNDAPEYYPLGTTIVTWTAFDSQGNEISCEQEVTILEGQCGEDECQSFGINTDDAWIQRVICRQLTDVTPDNNLISNTGNNGGYLQVGGMGMHVIPGSTNIIKVVPGFSSGSQLVYWRIWIDYNHDEEFSASEIIFQKTSSTQQNQTFTIPMDAELGAAEMRIAMSLDGYPEPCEIFQYGEVEDYKINIYDPINAFATATDSDESAIETEINIDAEEREVIQDFNVSLYPNPSHIETFLKIDSKGAIDLEMRIYDHLGRLVVDQQPITDVLTSIDVSTLTPGKYFLKLTGNQETIVKNFIVLSN